MSIKSDVDKDTYGDTIDESSPGTDSSQSEVDEPIRKKRRRCVYSNFQLDQLENAFDVGQYPDPYSVGLFSKNLNIPEKNIRVIESKLSPIISSLCYGRID